MLCKNTAIFLSLIFSSTRTITELVNASSNQFFVSNQGFNTAYLLRQRKPLQSITLYIYSCALVSPPRSWCYFVPTLWSSDCQIYRLRSMFYIPPCHLLEKSFWEMMRLTLMLSDPICLFSACCVFMINVYLLVSREQLESSIRELLEGCKGAMGSAVEDIFNNKTVFRDGFRS